MKFYEFLYPMVYDFERDSFYFLWKFEALCIGFSNVSVI